MVPLELWKALSRKFTTLIKSLIFTHKKAFSERLSEKALTE